MSWFNICTENLQKRCCRYLLQRYVGKFLEHKIEPDQLSINVLDGAVSLGDIVLDVQALNNVGDEHQLPFEFVEGSVNKISLSVPWRNMLKESSVIHIEGLSLTVRPNVKETEGIPSSMLESVWSSMSNSVYSSPDSDYEDNFDNAPESEQVTGLEVFTQAIESILNRIKVKFSNTVIKLEYMPDFLKLGLGLQLHIISLDYIDEVADESKEGIIYDSLAFLTKKLVIEGVFLQTYEFKYPKSNNGESISKTNITEPLTIAELTGTQAIRMVLKHNPSLPGPKLSLEINFGPLNVICSPRQLYLVIEILRGISKPLIEQKQKAPSQKPMSESDFNRIEQDLFNMELRPDTDVGLRGMQGWSNLDDEEEFFPLQCTKNRPFVPSMASSMTSSMSSIASSKSDLSSRHNRHKYKGKNEWLGETNHFSIHLTSLCVVLLHDDILAICPETGVITQCSLNEMRKISHQYLMAVQNCDIIKDCDKITKSIERNYLKLIATNVIMEGDEKTNETVKDVNITATGINVILMEILIETTEEPTQYIPILKFVQDTKNSTLKTSTNTISNKPDIQIQFKHNTKSTRYCNPVSSEIKILMQEAFSEVDISIINRLSSYIYYPDFKISKKSSLNAYQPQFNEVIESVNDTNLNCTLNFDYLVIKFRFPVPDLRPLSDINRLPWWKRILRNDILWLYLSDAECSFTKLSQQTITTGYEVQCRIFEALFQEGNTNNIIPIAKCKGFDDDLKTIKTDKNRRPKLVLRLCPVVSNQDEVKIGNFTTEHNMTSSVYIETSKKPSPFASKKIMRQRNHHSDCHEHESKLDNGEIQVVPGSREEIMEFVEHTNSNAKVYLDINVPCVFVTLPSKHIYETIYNRFTNDLFFWSPSFPTPASCGDDTSNLTDILDRTRYFAPCKSGIQFDSESESEDELSNVYYSCGQSSLNIADPMIKRTEFCLNLNIAQGLFTIITQSRDRSGRVIPQHYGELQITFEDLYLYLAAGYENTPRHNFICIQANKFCLSHENHSTSGSDILTPKDVVCRTNNSLKRVLYKTPDGMDFKERTGINKSDMLTVVVEISVCNHIKTIRVVNEINGTTLRHMFSVVAQSWYYQLSDFFDVVDYPVAGYESPHVITELHQHISDCLIDYRPLHLPYQCVLTVGNFSLSSNLVARSKASTLQIVSEDVAFFISDRLSKVDNLDLISNYICVMDLGVFELSLKLNKSSKQSNTVRQPDVDLRMAVNVIHIRTCADSAFALCRIISYLASDGDKSSIDENITEFEGVEQEDPVLLGQADSDNNSLSSLIMEAMHEETINIKKTKDILKTVENPSLNNFSPGSQNDKGIEVFYFPDETNKIVTPLDTQPTLQYDIEDDFIEKEFFFVDHDTGSGLLPRSNIPEVRILTDTQIRLVNNYFKAPVGKIDMLQAPKEYPIPVVRYTLREMTLIWHIYGGTDFNTKTTHNELTKHVTIVSETNSCPTSPNTLRPSLSRYYSQSNINSQKNPTSNKGSAKISQARTRFCCSVLPTSWQAKGGAGRQHHVLMQLQLNKVRFQHEVYPSHTKQAMRQVILIQDFEIRDKLASSNINKFLYLYSSEAMPKQHDANMLVAKAAYTRPDSNLKSQECCIKVSMLPLRLNIDQDSLIFLISFVNQFNSFGQKSKDEIVLNEKKTPKKSEDPIMTIGNNNFGQQDIVPNSLIQLNDEFDEHFGQKDIPVISKPEIGPGPSNNKTPVYIRQFMFSPDVTIRLDYEGRHIDLSQGSLAGLLMGLAQLNCSEITLKRIVHKHGLLGFDKLLTFITQEWLQDIKKHQLPSLLGGVGPMYSFVRLIQGFRDLIQLPIEQYQKDGRIVRGLQRGANSFTTSTAMAALEIATRIVNLIQRVAETTYDMVNPGPSMRQLRLQESKRKHRSNKRSHPADIREGVASAVMLVKEGLGETAQTIVRVASEEHEIKGTAGMVGGVMRQIPPTALTPIILASQATCNVLQGVRCQLAPDARVEAMQKWRCD